MDNSKIVPAPENEIQSAEVIVPCSELDQTLAFFTETLGFELELIFPADQPAVAIICGFGTRLRLQTGLQGPAPTLRLTCRCPDDWSNGGEPLIAPNGTRIELVEANPPIEIPAEQQSLVISKLDSDSQWVVGRAGMRYRDLIPGRQGGRFIASHIQITEGGPVPDYAHFHRIRFQMIYCYKGWVRVVYEDQGEPFVLNAGDCVIQPSQIRHRVLESSPGLEVIEISCPAEHETYADHLINLPTENSNSERDFFGQRFVYHCAAKAPWQEWRLPGFEARNTGIDDASKGLASAQVVRPSGDSQSVVVIHDHEFLFLFILDGTVRLSCDQVQGTRLNTGDSCVIPKGMQHALADCSSDLEFLEVRLPAEFPTRQHAEIQVQ